MSKVKRYILMIIFVLILAITLDVKADKISYGYVECDYRCGDKEEWNCHDRWSPRNSCKNADGTYVDTATMHPNSLGINIVDGHVQMLGSTDLFGKGTANYGHEKVSRIKLEENIDDVWVYKDTADPQTVLGWEISKTTTFYVHDYRPLINYINKTGKYPNYVVVSLYANIDIVTFFTPVWAPSVVKYTYYPSDLMAPSQDVNVSVTSYATGDYVLPYVNDGSSDQRLKKEYCMRTDLNDTLWESKCTHDVDTYNVATTVNYYYALDISQNADLNSCEDLDFFVDSLKDMYKKDGATKSYTELKNSINDYCEDFDNRVSSSFYFNTESKCFKRCHSYRNEMSNIDPNFLVETNYCGFGKDMVGWLMRILKILRYIVPIIVIVVSITEYISAIASADDDAMKKVGARFGKRLFIMILIFVLPSLLQFIFNIFNIDGLDKSNPYCLKF